jgi:hypothetical protein
MTWLYHQLEAMAPTLNQKYLVIRPIRVLVIVEGATEEILLPRFANTIHIDFYREGIYVLPAGGKNQVQQVYESYAETLRIPVFIVLDQDAQDKIEQLQAVLRSQDQIYFLEEGEFEDTYDLALVLETINRYYEPRLPVTVEVYEQTRQDLSQESNAAGRVPVLRQLWNTYELGEFDKVDFAQKLSATLTSDSPLPQSLKKLIQAMLAIRHDVLAL